MPLMKSGSKKAFEHNIKAEMHAGKPQDQSLAIAYDVKRKNRKKKAAGGSVKSGSPDMNYAHGGSVDRGPSEKANQSGVHRIVPNYDREHNEIKHGQSEARYGNKKAEHQRVLSELRSMPKPKLAEGGAINASNERRPMPNNMYDDKKMTMQNSGNKPPKDDNWLDKPTERQAMANNSRKVMKIKHPKMVPQSVYSVRMRDEEDDMQQSMSPGPYDEQPPRHDDEEGPDRQGPKVPDMQDEHSTHRKPYAKGGMIDEMNHPSKHDMEPQDDEMYERERMDEAHLMSMEDPSEDEGAMDAHSRNEIGQDRQGPAVSDMEDEHSTGRKPYAGGGRIGDDLENEDHDMEMNPAHGHYSADDSEMQPEDEKMEEHHNSIAAAIMAKKDRKASQMSDSDMDEMMRLYNGGEIMERRGKILSHDSIYSDDSDQADLSRNADEDANEEDQLSFNALEKENYSESEGLRQLDSPRDSGQHGDSEEMNSHDEHDMVDSIRRKMKSKRQF